MGRRPASHIVVALVLLALLGAACRSDSGGDGSSASRSGSGSGGGAPADVLRVGIERPQSLDPAQARTPAELLVAEQLFDALTSYDPATAAVRPGLAARWQASGDQKRWDFTLRPGAVFANGRPVTSADVKYTLERIARKGSSSPAAAQLSGIAGFRAFNLEGKADVLAGVSLVSPEVVRVDLDQPQAALPAILGHPAFGVVPREAVETESPAFSQQPVGSGPFMVGSRGDDVISLVPSPGVSVPLRGIELRIVPDLAASYASFLDGGLDWTEVPADRVEQAAERHGPAASRPYLGELFYGFNLKSPKFADVRFREAIVRAIDRTSLVRAIYGGAARPSDGLVPAGVPGFVEGACGERCRFDPERSRALVREVFGGGAPPEVQLDFDDNATQRAVAQAIQANLRDAGIPAALRPHAFAEYLKFAVSGQQELFRYGSIGAYPSPDAFLLPLFQAGVTENVTGFSSPPFEQLVRSARAEPDEARRVAVYQQAEKLVLEQVPVIPLAQFEFHSLASARVTGLVTSGLGTFDATQVRVGR